MIVQPKRRQRTWLTTFEAFLAMFRALHPGFKPPLALSFRLRLLKFACLFTVCVSPEAFEILRYTANGQDAGIGNAERIGENMEGASQHDGHGNDIAKTASTSAFGGHTQTVTLLETLPSFMALSAAQNTGQGSNVTDVWLHLAGLYMAQAAIEQGLAGAEMDNNIIHNVFEKWTFDPNLNAPESSDEWQINAMFWGDDEVVPEWEKIKEKYKQSVVSPINV